MLNNRKEFFAIQPLDGSKGWIELEHNLTVDVVVNIIKNKTKSGDWDGREYQTSGI